MIQKIRPLTSIGRINHMRYKTLPSRCGREVCRCLKRLDLKDKNNKKFYNDCYDGWYKYTMRNLLELD